jgi:hypothetical protein
MEVAQEAPFLLGSFLTGMPMNPGELASDSDLASAPAFAFTGQGPDQQIIQHNPNLLSY